MLALILAVILTSQARPADACADPRHREFDFWLGTWEVNDPAGKPQGTNRIERIEGGCAIQENWTGANGMTGRSVNAYQPATGRWHQMWVSNRGAVLLIDGGFDGRSMVMTGSSATADGVTVQNRITWTPLGDGRVRQLWEQTGGREPGWRVVFEGLYTRKTQ